MDVTESYRILELEIGASRAEVDAAYCRLVEHWHPDRAASEGPEAVRESQRRVQAINEAYHTLAKISPNSVKQSDHPTASVAPPIVVKTKPRLPPLSNGQPTLGRSPPPPPPPPSETWAARAEPVASATPPPIPASPPVLPSAHSFPPPQAPALPPPVAGTPPAPSPNPVTSTSETSVASPASSSHPHSKVPGLYDSLFPPGSRQRRFAPVIIGVAVAVFLLLGKCAFSSTGRKSSSAGNSIPDPKTTGSLVVKSNFASATIEATRVPEPGNATMVSVTGAIDQLLSGLPPGKYAVTTKAEGWPEVREEVVVDAERTTEVALNFKGGSLHIDSDPTGATVRRGAAVLGRTPLVIPQLPPGVNQLSLDYPSWPVVSLKTTIAEGVESIETVRLPHGKLTVETIPPGTTVLLAGRVIGQTPLTVGQFPAGTRKLTLQARDFPPLEVTVTLEDRSEVKLQPVLGSVFPVLDPSALLRAIWVPDDEDKISPPLEGVTGPFQSRNGVVKNLNRKWLYEAWLRKRYCFTAIVKSYDQTSGQIEFTEQQSPLSKYRVLATLSPEARSDPEVTAQLIKGATFAFYGRLSAVEEPRWPSKVITFEFSSAEPLR